MNTNHLSALVVALPVSIYCIVGIVYLCAEYDVVHRCHASNVNSNVIWVTSVWSYVLTSVIAAALVIPVLLLIPFEKSLETVVQHWKRLKKSRSTRDKKVRVKWGTDLPDWILLMHGFALIGGACILGVLAFCGYWELYVAKPWCEDRSMAFEELALWHFGHFTLIMQIVTAVAAFFWGALWWTMPCLMELSLPEGGATAARSDDA